tara:strand:+ start:302 stop:2230 length:1929 start_codon:yes stop_codon:yes gene_type:complete
MLFSLNFLELIPLGILNLYFFFIFCSVIALSYPFGRYFLYNYCENNLIKNSLFSISVFATLISILMNLAPILSKYVIVIFYLLNLAILTINSNIRKDFFGAIISFKFTFFISLLVFLLASMWLDYFHIENGNLIYFFDIHHTYYWDPISEIFTSDYFSRIRISSLYPAEWSSFHFFQAGFHSILLSPVYLAGTLGLLTLKKFYVSIFFSLFLVSFFSEDGFKKEKNINILFKVIVITLIIIIFFSPQVIWLIQTNGLVSAILVLFIAQSILSKNKNDLLVWAIILSISSFRNGLISLMLTIYFLIDSEVINFNTILNKIKKSLNLPNIFLSILFLIYFIASFYQSSMSFHHPKYSLPSDRAWWELTVTNHVIQNYQLIILIFILLVFSYFVLLKYFYKKKIPLFTKIKKIDFLYFNSVLIIPFCCLFLLFIKSQLNDFFDVRKLEIFFDQFNLTNLSYFFFVSLIWCLILICLRALDRYIFIITIIFYTFLSIFIYNAITLPAFFVVELIVLLLIFKILFKFKNVTVEMMFSYLFMISLVVSIIFSSSSIDAYLKHFEEYSTGEKLSFKVEEIKQFKQQKYLCPQDIKNTNVKNYSSALSSILVIPYYTHLEIPDIRQKQAIGSLDFAIPPKKHVANPCVSE